MSDPSHGDRSGLLGTSIIPYSPYFAEKANFAGSVIGAILYGIVIVLFFRCMAALYDKANRAGEGIRWGLVAYAAAMFSFVTIFTATNLKIQSISYVDNREFPGMRNTGCVLPPGPLGYQFSIYSTAISVGGRLMFHLNNWLADGLLLYRCHAIYSMSYIVVAFPCLMYLASLATGIMFLYQNSQPDSSIWNPGAMSFGLPYFAISVSLNILLTLMIVTRILLLWAPARPSAGASGLYRVTRAIVIMLVESSALYSITSLLFIIPWGAKSSVAYIFLPILAETQVIASLLVIGRVADRSAIRSDPIVPVDTGSPDSLGQGKRMDGNKGVLGRSPLAPVESCRMAPRALSVGVATAIDIHRNSV